MDDKTGLGIVTGLALGIAIVLLIMYLKGNSDGTGVMYTYDNDNRLQAILPMKQPVELRPV